MNPRSHARIVVVASMLAVAGAPASLFAQDQQASTPAKPDTAGTQPQVGSQTSPVVSGKADETAQEPTGSIRFQFKDTPFSMVFDFFSKETGLPIIAQAPIPSGTMTFIGGTEYSFAEALSILNLNLKMHNVQLQHEKNFLYLRSIKDAARTPTPVVSAEHLPEGVTPDMIVTMTLPLNNTRASEVAKQISPLMDEFGAVTPVDAQNILILIDTAAQCNRIASIVRTIDAVQPVDSDFKVFKLKYAEPKAVVQALKGLVGQNMQTVFIDKDGKKTITNEVNIAGLNMQPDERTNSIIVKGPKARIDVVEKLVAVLDVPDDSLGKDRQMATFALETITPAQAVKSLTSLFSSVKKEDRPTVVALPDVNKVTIVAAEPLLLQATALIGEIDPSAMSGNVRKAQPERVVKTLSLEHITASQADAILRRMLTARQQQVVRYSPTPDGQGFLVSGPTEDVTTFLELARSLDVPRSIKNDVRVVRVDVSDIKATVAKALQLDSLSDEGKDDPITATVDEASHSVTLVGSPSAISRFQRRLSDVERSTPIETVSQSYKLATAKPSALIPKLTRLAKPLLTPDDGTPYVAPKFEALDEMDTLVVRAKPDQHAVIAELIKQFDTTEPVRRDFRVVHINHGDPTAIRDRALKLLDQLNAGLDEDERGHVEVQVDEAAGSLLVFADRVGMNQFNAVLGQVQQLVPPDRTTQVIDVRNVKASKILEPLETMLASADPIDPSRKIEPPTITVLDRTNSLIVTAESAQHRLVRDLVSRLDRPDPAAMPPMRILQLRTADATRIASMLQKRYQSRSLTERSSMPVDIQAEAQTNTLIVTAPDELFEDVKAQVDILNQEGSDEPERTTKLFPLKSARAADVAAAMDKLYPEPPMPVDRYKRPMPWLRKPKEVTVSADPSSNSLIFDAPTERIPDLEELAKQLDRVEVPPQAELRTFRVVQGDLQTIASTLSGLARQGALSAVAQPGKQAVKVMVQAEPKSNTLIVAGDDYTFKKVEEILQSLSAVPVEKGLRIVPIANVPAGDVRDRALTIYNAQIEGLPDAKPVEVTVDDNSNSLEIVGRDEDLSRFMAIIDQLQRQAGPAREVRLIELKLAKVDDVIKFLREMVAANESLTIQGGPTPVFEAIEATNSIMVAAQPSQMAVIEQLIRSVDAQQTGERPPLRILRLRTTDATNLAKVLQASYDSRPVEDRTKKPVDIKADASTNTLIVSAHPDVLPEIEQIVEELNETQAMDAQGREIRIFPLKWARAEELARTIDEMFPQPPMPYDSRGRPMPHLRQQKEVFVRADRATNSLIVDAPAKRLSGFEQIVKSLDQQNLSEDVEVRTYHIERAELATVAKTLRDLSTSGAMSTNSRTPITINTENSTRTLIVSGPTSVFASVEKVLSQLEQAPDRPATVMKMYPLKFARAEQLKTLLDDILSTKLRDEQRAQGRSEKDVEDLLEVASHGPSNTLIITAPESIQKIAEELIKSLDTEAAAAGRRTVHVLPLTYADAAEVSRTLIQALPGMDLPSGEKVAIIPAPGSNAIILSGASADLKKVEALVEPLDVRPVDPETMGVETFKLKHADARDIARTVQNLLVEQQETDPRMMLLRMRYSRNANLFKKPTIRVEAEERTNALIVSGPSATIELAKMIIERLDQPADMEDRQVATFSPSKADPNTLVSLVGKIVEETLPQERRKLELRAEPSSRTVVAIGTKTQLAQAMKLLAEFDERAFSLPEVTLTVHTLEHAEARAMASTLQAMASDRSRWPESLRDAQAAGLAVATPRISADATNNRLIVSAPSVLEPMIAQLITTLDQPSGREVAVRLFPLKQGDAASVAKALSVAFNAGAKPGEPKATAVAEPTSNTVIVTGSDERLSQAQSMIAAMDETIEPNGMGVRTIMLKHAMAESVAPIVEQILTKESIVDKLPEWSRWQYLSRNRNAADDSRTVRVAAERRLNAIVIAAPLDTIDLAMQIIKELDVDPNNPNSPGGLKSQRLVRVIPLLNADANALASSIEAMFAEDASFATPPIVRVDASGNALIVRASSEQMAMIESLARDLDKASLASSQQMRMIPVDRTRADAGLMAMTIKRMLEEQGGVQVEIISAEQLLDDEAPDEQSDSQGKAGSWLWLPKTNLPEVHQPWLGLDSFIAVSMVGQVDDTTTQPESPQSRATQPDAGQHAGDGDEGSKPTIRIAVDPASNSLVVIGSPRMTDRIAAIAKQLESQMPVESSGVHIVTLPEHADAGAINQLVNQTIRQIGSASARNPGGFTSRVAVSPDATGNALIVWANRTDFDSIKKLIASLVQIKSDDSMMVKVYPLENMTAANAQRAIMDLISANPRGRLARRVRGMDMTIEGQDGAQTQGMLDPSSVRIIAPRGGTSLLVAAPPKTIGLIDSLIGMLDQNPVAQRMAIHRYRLENARAVDLAKTLQTLFDAQRKGASGQSIPQARFVPDARTNSILVTASTTQHEEVERLLKTTDMPAVDDGLELAILKLDQADPQATQRIIESVVIGNNPGKKDRIHIAAEKQSGVLIVRAAPDDLEQIKALVAQIDADDVAGLPVHAIVLKRADAMAVAQTLTQFFRDRQQALARSGKRVRKGVAITGDRQSGTLVISASDADFEQIKQLVEKFDNEKSAVGNLTFEVVPLKNARVKDLQNTLQDLADNLTWSNNARIRSGRATGNDQDKLFLEFNDRLNAVVVMGQGESMEVIKRIIAQLDVPFSEKTAKIVKAVPILKGDPQTIANAVRDAMDTGQQNFFYWPPREDTDKVTIEVDARRRSIILVGPGARVEEAMSFIKQLDTTSGKPNMEVKTLPLRYADAAKAAADLTRFFQQRARAEGLPADSISIIGSRNGNLLLVTADADRFAEIENLVKDIDQPEMGDDREIQIVYLQNGTASNVAQAVRAMFPQTGRLEDRVIVTPQADNNSLLVSAPPARIGQVENLIAELDSAPRPEDVNIASVPLEHARAMDVAQSLRQALPSSVKITITPVVRSNALLLTGADETVRLVKEQVAKLDIEPEQQLQVFKRVQLSHVMAGDVKFTLSTLLRDIPRGAGEPEPRIDYSPDDNTLSIFATPSQTEQIVEIVKQLDVANNQDRKTEFVKLEYADAEQTSNALKMFYGRLAKEAKTFAAKNVSILADKASNSLVISADMSEWENIRNLLKKLDTPEYDTSRQLVVLPLKHADATSVAKALNEGFRQSLQDQINQQRARQQNNRPRNIRRDPRDISYDMPAVLVDAEGVPSVAAEVQTNSLIVSAGRKELERIEKIVEQLDVPEFVTLPDPVVIPIKQGKASAIAQTISAMFSSQNSGKSSRRSARIVGDDAANSLIVRAEEDDLLEIWSLARSLQEQSSQKLLPQIVQVEHVPVARLRDTVQQAFAPVAQSLGQTLVVGMDRTSNSLIISAPPTLFEQVKAFVETLDNSDEEADVQSGDGSSPADHQARKETNPAPGVQIVEVHNNDPKDIIAMLEKMGVTKAVPTDRFGIVSEPVTLVALTSKQAISVVGSRRDMQTIADLISVLDATPVDVSQDLAIVPLKVASAQAVVSTLKNLLNISNQDVSSGPATSVAEHFRRLNMVRGFGHQPIGLDIAIPIRLIEDGASNAVIVASSAENVAALEDLIHTLDTLPIGDAVMVRIFPLENASAVRIKSIVEELFSKGEALRRLPGTDRRGLPPTATGQALAGEIAVSIDDRTNSLIVAGREEAVALVEVLIKDLDRDSVGNWVEPTVVSLEYADARTIADLLNRVIVNGSRNTPQAVGLQQQIARLRVLRQGGDPTDPTSRIESDLFVPLTHLVIEPEPISNALIIVGTPANISVVKELISSLDVEQAAAGNEVRFFPLVNAAADRVRQVLVDVFSQREQARVLRPEDHLIIAADTRTNSLVVSTSPRSFEVVESLLKTLDAKDANYTVGLHVLPVPGADVASLAPKLQQLMKERIDAAHRAGGIESPTDTFSVVADPSNNLLILTCSQENLELVKELLATIDEQTADMEGQGNVDLIQLKHARADEVARSITDVYVSRENKRRGENAVSVTAESRLNALVVRGSEEDIANIRSMVDRFDTSEILNVQDVRRFELKSANANEVVRLLQTVLAGRALNGSSGSVRATKLRYLRKDISHVVNQQAAKDVTEAEVDDFIREQVRLTADLRTNSVIVSAPPQVVTLIEAIMNDLDSSTAGSRNIETFPLKNADARAMAEVLTDLFNLQIQGNSMVLVPTGNQNDKQEDINNAKVTAVPDERQELSITIDARTNTLLVSGTDEYLKLVRNVVNELDSIVANEREQLVFHLTNAKAKDLEQTLQQYFQTEADRRRQILGGSQGVSGSVSRQLEQEVTVVGDEKSNKLLISASPRYIDSVEKIVAELDSAPPQVMIQVLLAEVTLDDEDTWGTDIKVGGATGLGNDAYRFGSFAAGGALASALGTPNFSVSSVDFELMVRALEVQGKLEVLSRPQVTVKNNEQARIQVGENIGFLGGTTQSGSGNVTANIIRQDVGIIMDVTPTISEDGFVQLLINPEISALTSRTIQVSGDTQTPIISRRVVNTTVSVMDGQTVVIGGLIQTTQEERNWKVPLLGDIPLVGAPFRSTKKQNVKTELLMILTPHVIPGGLPAVNRYQILTDSEINRLTDPRRVIDEVGPVTPPPDHLINPHTPNRSNIINEQGASDMGDVVDFDSAPLIRSTRITPASNDEEDTIDWDNAPRIEADTKSESDTGSKAGSDNAGSGS